MAKVSGVDKQEYLRRLYGTAITEIDNYVKDTVDNYKAMIAEYEEQSKVGFWDWASLIIWPPFTIIRGMLEGGLDMFTGFVDFGAKFLNDAAHIFDDEDGTSWQQDVAYMFKNLEISFKEGVTVAFLGAAAEIGGLFGADKEWAYGENGMVSNVADNANRQRGAVLSGNMDITAEEGKELVDDRFDPKNHNLSVGLGTPRMPSSIDDPYAYTYNLIQDANKFNNWVKNNVTGYLQLPSWQKISKEYPVFNFLDEAVYNVGRMIPVIALSYAAPQIGLSATMAKVLTNVYFGASVFGSSMNEALNNGASIQDATTYAIGNAGIELATEAVGGIKLGEVLKNVSWGGLVSMMVEEGTEEVMAELTQKGFGYYSNPEHKIESADTVAESWGNLFYAFMGGAVSSAMIGGSVMGISRMSPEGQAQASYIDLQKQMRTPDGKINQEKFAAKMSKNVNAVLKALNSENVSNDFKNTILKDGFENEGSLLSISEIVDKKQVDGVTQYTLNEKGKQLEKGDIFGKQDGQTISRKTHAVSSDTFQDYISEIETIDKNNKKVKQKVKISTRQDVDNIRDKKLQQKVKWILKKVKSVIFATSPDGGNWGAFVDAQGRRYIDMNSIADVDNLIMHEISHVIKQLADSKKLTSGGNAAWLAFDSLFNKDNVVDEILKSVKEIDPSFELMDESKYEKLYGNRKNAEELIKQEKIAHFIQKFFLNDKLLAYLMKKDTIFDNLSDIFNKKANYKALLKHLGLENVDLKDFKYVVDLIYEMQRAFKIALKANKTSINNLTTLMDRFSGVKMFTADGSVLSLKNEDFDNELSQGQIENSVKRFDLKASPEVQKILNQVLKTNEADEKISQAAKYALMEYNVHSAYDFLFQNSQPTLSQLQDYVNNFLNSAKPLRMTENQQSKVFNVIAEFIYDTAEIADFSILDYTTKLLTSNKLNDVKISSTKNNIVYNANCLVMAKTLKEQGMMFDAILTDPPYQHAGDIDLKNKQVWDRKDLTDEWLEAYAPLVKDGGAVLVFADKMQIGKVTAAFAKNGIRFVDYIIWEKTSPNPKGRQFALTQDKEFIVYGVKGVVEGTFNYLGGNYSPTIWKENSPRGKIRFHPTQKPVSITERALRQFTQEGDLVLDMFMGSGTTGVAAAHSNRKFVGIEQNKKYFYKAIERLNDAEEAHNIDTKNEANNVSLALDGKTNFFKPSYAKLETFKPTEEAKSRAQDGLIALTAIYKMTTRIFAKHQTQTITSSSINLLLQDFIKLVYKIGDINNSDFNAKEILDLKTIDKTLNEILGKNIISSEDYLNLRENIKIVLTYNTGESANNKVFVTSLISSTFIDVLDFLIKNKIITTTQATELITTAIDKGTFLIPKPEHFNKLKNILNNHQIAQINTISQQRLNINLFDKYFNDQTDVFKQMREELREAAVKRKQEQIAAVVAEEQAPEIETLAVEKAEAIIEQVAQQLVFKDVSNSHKWRKNDIVKHPSFGIGQILEVRKEQQTENAKNIEKTLLSIIFQGQTEQKMIDPQLIKLQYLKKAQDLSVDISSLPAVETPKPRTTNVVVAPAKVIAETTKVQENKPVIAPEVIVADKVGEIPLDMAIVKNKEGRIEKIKSHIRVFSYIWSKYNQASERQEKDISAIKESKVKNVDDLIKRRKEFSALSKKIAFTMKSALSLLAQSAQITDQIFKDSKYVKFPKEPAISYEEREVLRTLEENRRKIENGTKPIGEKTFEIETIRQIAAFYEGLLKLGLISYKGLYNLHNILTKKKYLTKYKGFNIISEQLKNETFASQQAKAVPEITVEQNAPKVGNNDLKSADSKDVADIMLAITPNENSVINTNQQLINEAIANAKASKIQDYKDYDRSYALRLDEIISDVGKSTSSFNKKLFKIIKNNNDYMRKIIHGNKVINHLTANIAYQIINRFYDLRKTLKTTDNGKTYNFTPEQINDIRAGVNRAIFSALAYADSEVRVEINITDENPNGYLYKKAIHWFLRDMLGESKWSAKKADKYRKDWRGKAYWSLMDAINNLDQPQGVDNLIRVLNDFAEATEVDTITDMALHTIAEDEPHTIETTREQWHNNLLVLESINSAINRKVKINSTMDAFTVAEIISGFQEDSWANVLMRKIAQGNIRQLHIRRLFTNIFSQEWLKQNYKKVVGLEKKRAMVSIESLGGAKMRISQVVFLRAMVLREILRNRFIEQKRMNGNQTQHFADGNEIEILDIGPDLQKKKDNATHATLTNSIELYNELDAIIQNDAFAKEYASMVGSMFEQYFPLINERYKEINGQPMQNEGAEIADSISDQAFKNIMLNGLSRELSVEEIRQMYAPFLLKSGNYFQRETIKAKDILDLGVFDGMTEEITDSNGIVSVESINSVIFEYTNEVSNYYGLHRISRDLNIILRQEIPNSKQTRYLSDMIPIKFLEYFETLLKDMAGYKNPPRNKTFKRITTFVRRNFYRYSLGANVKVIFTQFATVLNLSAIYGTGNTFFFNFIKNLYAQHTKNNKGKIKKLKDTDNIYWERTMDSNYEIGEARQGGLEAYKTFNRFMNILMRGISFTDTAINNAFYLTLLETRNPDTGKMHTEAEAQEKLDKGILRSQSSASDMTKAPWLRSDSDIIRIMLKFMGEPLKLVTQIENSVNEVSYGNKITKNKDAIIEKVENEYEQYNKAAQVAKGVLDDINEIVNDGSFNSLTSEEQSQLLQEQRQATRANAQAQRNLQNAKTRLEDTQQHVNNIEQNKTKARNLLVRRLGALVSTVSYLSVLQFLFGLARTKGGKKDKPIDEDMLTYLLKQFGMAFADELIGMMPFVRDAYQALAKGFDFADIDEARSINDLTQTLYYLFADIASGDEIKWSKTLYNLIKSISGIFGIPFNNIERLITTPLLYISESGHYQYNAFFGKRTRDNVEMADAIKNNDDAMIAAIVNNKIKKRNIIVSNAVKTELARLAKTGNEVVMSGVNDKYTVDGEEYTLTREQKEKFAEIYNKADLIIQKVIRHSKYKKLSDEKKKTLIQAIYNYYYQYAKEEVLDVEILPESTHFRTLNASFQYFLARADALYKQQKKD